MTGMTTKRGPRSAALLERDRQRLRRWQSHYGRRLGVPIGLPQMRRMMDAPFSWETLQRALCGRRVSLDNYHWLRAFLSRVDPTNEPRLPSAAPDFKSRAAGERDAEPETEDAADETAQAARTLRGSR